jgi:hypothetical protein
LKFFTVWPLREVSKLSQSLRQHRDRRRRRHS